MELNILGYYGGYPYANVGTSAYLLKSEDFNLLLDCGSGALLALETVLDPLKLDAVVLSHYHYDHIADVGVLQYYWQLRQNTANKALPIYGQAEDQANFEKLTWQNATVKQPYQVDEVLAIGPFELTFLKTEHPVTAYAMRIVEKNSGKVLGFTADTAYFDDLVPFFKDCDVLITDTNYPASQTGKLVHMTSAQSGDLAKKAGVKQLILSHLPQRTPLTQIKEEAIMQAGNVKTYLASEIKKIEL